MVHEANPTGVRAYEAVGWEAGHLGAPGSAQASLDKLSSPEACRSRALLTQVAVDGMAGPHRNTTVLFLGSNDGTVLKVLPPGGQSLGSEPIVLEEIDAYSHAR